MKKLFLSLSVLLAPVLAGCEFEEGVNAHDVSGTVYVPKSVAPTAEDVGMIYVGLYAGVDMHLGYPSPIAAPAASTAGADTFPYGGTSIGVFTTRDVRTICQVVSGRTIRDDGDQWALDFQILQFPFHDGAVAWAWMDRLTFVGTTVTNAYGSCDSENGYYDYYQIRVTPIDVEPAGTNWLVHLEDSELPNVPGSDSDRRYQDAKGQLWEVNDVDVATDTIEVQDVYSFGGRPAQNGPSDTLIMSYDDLLYYGSQRQDVLNFPGKYIDVGDFVTEEPFVLENSNDGIEITIDYERT